MRQERLLRAQPSVPFVDPRTAHDELKVAILADFTDLADSNAFTNGLRVTEFERAFAEYHGSRRWANTFAATLEAVGQADPRSCGRDRTGLRT
jgi:dTDP-4-amino-4,6-dideoxygalactose transaminase